MTSSFTLPKLHLATCFVITVCILLINLYSKVLEFIKAAQMPLTEQVFAALITAYGVNGYVCHSIVYSSL